MSEYFIVRYDNLQICCLCNSGKIVPIIPNSDCVKRFGSRDEAWEACEAFPGSYPFVIRPGV
jgi:hypothetical protein